MALDRDQAAALAELGKKRVRQDLHRAFEDNDVIGRGFGMAGSKRAGDDGDIVGRQAGKSRPRPEGTGAPDVTSIRVRMASRNPPGVRVPRSLTIRL